MISFITTHSEQGRDTLAMLMPKASVSFNEEEARFLFLCGLAKIGEGFLNEISVYQNCDSP